MNDEFGEELPSWIQVKEVTKPLTKQMLHFELDTGEASAIALCLEEKDSLLLIDERKGRKVARRLNLKLLGTLGVLIQAKEQRLIPSLKDEVQKLKSVGFRLSDRLIEQVLWKYEKG